VNRSLSSMEREQIRLIDAPGAHVKALGPFGKLLPIQSELNAEVEITVFATDVAGRRLRASLLPRMPADDSEHGIRLQEVPRDRDRSSVRTKTKR
jgi:hypothetical protein